MKYQNVPAWQRVVAGTLTLIWLSTYSVQAFAVDTLFEDFDSFRLGITLEKQVEGVIFLLPLEVFEPSEGRTKSRPNAARNKLDCNDVACSNGAYRVEMEFVRLVRSVSLRAGDVLRGCFEFDCPYAQLVGFNKAGDIVAASEAKRIPSGTIKLPAGFDAEITEQFKIDAGDFTIFRAKLFVGKDDVYGRNLGAPRPAQIDSLRYTMLEEGESPPSSLTPDMPQVEIIDPLPDDVFLHTDLLASGRITAPASVVAFCIVANANESTFPARCDAATAVRTDSDRNLVFGPTRVQGELNTNSSNMLTVFLQDGLGQIATDSVTVNISPDNLDLTVEAVEVTQVVQIKDIHTQADAIWIPSVLSIPGLAAPYEGVPLAEQKKTVARVFVSGAFETTGDLGSARVREVPMLLHGFTSRVGELPGTPIELPGSPIRPDAGSPVIEGIYNLAQLRADPKGAFTFTLPVSWTEQPEITLAAELAPVAATTSFIDVNQNDNGLFVEGIPFTPQRQLNVWPVSLVSIEGGVTSRPNRPLSQYFQDVIEVTPAPIRVYPILAEIDITEPVVSRRQSDGSIDSKQVINAAIDLIAEATEGRELNGKIVALTTTNGVTSGKGPGPIAATGSINRKLDFVAHELYHTYGFKHASNACGASGGEEWSPDTRGLLHGIGLNPRFGSGGEPRLYQPIGKQDPAVFDATPAAPAEVHDFMSYCSDESTNKTWLSTDYWTVGVRGFAPGGNINIGSEGGCCRLSTPDDVTARQNSLRVTAIIEPDGATRIIRVSSVIAVRDSAVLDTGIELRLLNDVGDIVARTDVEPVEFSGRPGPGQVETEASLYVAATLAGTNAQTAELVVNGRVIAMRHRSVNPPTVQIQYTPTGHCIGFGDNSFGSVPADADFTLDYNASDTDGDILRGKVEFSPDGQSWNTLSTGIVNSPVFLSGDLLSQSDTAYLRVTVNDGFNNAVDTCGPFATDGRGIKVTITSPAEGAELNADSTLYLQGFAFDDAGEAISNVQLEWRSGGQILGQDEVLTVPAYMIDTNEGVTLIAEADDGTIGQASVGISILQVRPLFLEIEARPLLGEARVIALRVSSTMPELLYIMGSGITPSTYSVSPESQIITIKLDQRLETHNLKLLLGNGQLQTTKKMVVERIRMPGRK